MFYKGCNNGWLKGPLFFYFLFLVSKWLKGPLWKSKSVFALKEGGGGGVGLYPCAPKVLLTPSF